LQSNDRQFSVKPLLDALRAEYGDSEFGYRMQGFFAHVLVRLGAVVIEVNAQGHPDIKAHMADELLLVQVKSAQHAYTSSVFQLSITDLEGITCREGARGYLAYLDCAEPVSWYLVDSVTARQFLNRPVPVAAIRGAQDRQLSEECSNEFVDAILSAKDRLSLLTFRLLAQRAIAGNPI